MILLFSGNMMTNSFAETFEFIDENGNEELVSVFVSTNKESYLVGDDLEFTLTIDSPWQGVYDVWGTDSNNENLHFFNYNVIATDGGGKMEYDVRSTGEGIEFQYFTGTSKVKIENFWDDKKPNGDYDFCFMLYNYFQICRDVEYNGKLIAELPEWVRNTFIWYAEGVVSENELLNSITYLVKNNIISIENNKDSDKDETIANLADKINSMLNDIKQLENKIIFLEEENTKLKANQEYKTEYEDTSSQQSKPDSSQSNTSDSEVESDPELTVYWKEAKATDLVINFKYNSNNKYILNDVLDLVLDERFGNDLAEVLDNPSTEWYWIGWMYPKYADPNIWEITYKMKTYNFDFEPHFLVDMTTGKVSAANNDADGVLQILKKIS